MNDQQLTTTEPSTAKPRRPKTMTPAALEANRKNAAKSTGPRSPQGKLKAASNSLKHGLYSGMSSACCVPTLSPFFLNVLEMFYPISSLSRPPDFPIKFGTILQVA